MCFKEDGLASHIREHKVVDQAGFAYAHRERGQRLGGSARVVQFFEGDRVGYAYVVGAGKWLC